MEKRKLRKRYGEAKAPVEIDWNDPKWASVRWQLEDSTPLSDEETQAAMRLLRTGK
jgi:hypothetical protein